MCNRTSMHRSKKPCAVIGLSECEKETEALLTSPAIAGDRACEGTFEQRDGYEYITQRGREEVSVLVGVRSAVADNIETLLWSRKFEGDYKARNGNKMRAYIRTLIAKITLKNHVGYVGNELRVAVCHLHFMVANKNKGLRKKKTMAISGHGWQRS